MDFFANFWHQMRLIFEEIWKAAAFFFQVCANKDAENAQDWCRYNGYMITYSHCPFNITIQVLTENGNAMTSVIMTRKVHKTYCPVQMYTFYSWQRSKLQNIWCFVDGKSVIMVRLNKSYNYYAKKMFPTLSFKYYNGLQNIWYNISSL